MSTEKLTQDGMRIMFAEISEFKGIKHQVIHFDGRSAWLIGGNGQGKSSIIDALLCAIDSQYIPQKPIKDDEERGLISLTVAGQRNGEFDQYQIDITFTPSKRTGVVKVKDKDGNDLGTSARTIIKDIFGKISFDIYQFLTDKKVDQIKTLKELTGCGDKLDAIDIEITELEAERKALNKEITEYQAVNKRENRPFSDSDIDDFKDPVSEEAILQKISDVGKSQQTWDTQNNGVKETVTIVENNSIAVTRLSNEILELEAQIEKKRQTISELHKTNEEYQTKIDKAHAWLEKHPRPNVDKLTEELSEARKHNKMHDIIDVYAKRQKEIRAKQDSWEQKDTDIKQKRQDKIDLIASSQLPVKGLNFSEDEITLDGIPIEQINTQTKLDLGADITIAMKKPLRLAMIREGSLYDKPHLTKTLQKFDEMGIQWICEWVRPEGGPLEIKFEETDLTTN